MPSKRGRLRIEPEDFFGIGRCRIEFLGFRARQATTEVDKDRRLTGNLGREVIDCLRGTNDLLRANPTEIVAKPFAADLAYVQPQSGE